MGLAGLEGLLAADCASFCPVGLGGGDFATGPASFGARLDPPPCPGVGLLAFAVPGFPPVGRAADSKEAPLRPCCRPAANALCVLSSTVGGALGHWCFGGGGDDRALVCTGALPLGCTTRAGVALPAPRAGGAGSGRRCGATLPRDGPGSVSGLPAILGFAAGEVFSDDWAAGPFALLVALVTAGRAGFGGSEAPGCPIASLDVGMGCRPRVR
mmetsp:Transcript_55774/g.148621  ORF Transcript_55774/g.148621 Transcript_55774/m.148621 type:complete len:213 (-) Transcript_55774:128-766(-)